VPQTRRTYAETLRFFDGMEVVPPGLVQCHRWRPDPGTAGLGENVSAWGGAGRKV
jgi:S-adenosyl methyltransferase